MRVGSGSLGVLTVPLVSGACREGVYKTVDVFSGASIFKEHFFLNTLESIFPNPSPDSMAATVVRTFASIAMPMGRVMPVHTKATPIPAEMIREERYRAFLIF
jgi:hypothetical protein